MEFRNNIWWTRKAKIQTEKRLLSNVMHAEALLLWYSFFSVAMAVYYLKSESSSVNQDLSAVAWIAFSVLVLCISGFIKGLTFKERSSLVKECYEALNVLYLELGNQNCDVKNIQKEYSQLLAVCENHTEKDYYQALCTEYATKSGKADRSTGLKKGLDRCPTWYHLGCLIMWQAHRFILLASLYAFPILIVVALRYWE